jgi:hypothetical protein
MAGRRATPVAILGVILVACSAGAQPDASDPVIVATPTATSPPASATPMSPVGVASHTPTPSPTGQPTPSPAPAPKLSKAEQGLVGALREDARVDCRPRRADLPWGASAGVECRGNSTLVSRVGVYALDDPVALESFVGAGLEPNEAVDQMAATVYFARLGDYDVAPQSGNCRKGKPGDASWPDYLPDSGIGPWDLSPWRWGCYLDEYNQANIRVTCYGGVYIGIVGKTSDIAALSKWAWRPPNGQSADRDPPGICYLPD